MPMKERHLPQLGGSIRALRFPWYAGFPFRLPFLPFLPFLLFLLFSLCVGSTSHAQEAAEPTKLVVAAEPEAQAGGQAGGQEDAEALKATSATSKAHFDRLRASVNPFSVMALLPGASSGGWDTTDWFNHKALVTPVINLRRIDRDPLHSAPLGVAAGRSKQDTAVALDMGALYKSSLFKASATAFLVKFKDRLASTFEPGNGNANGNANWNANGNWNDQSKGFNTGSPTFSGVEVQAATPHALGFSAFASVNTIQGYTDGKPMAPGGPFLAPGFGDPATGLFQSRGLLLPDPAQSRAGRGSQGSQALFGLQYAQSPVQVNLAGRYTARRQVTLLGDQSLAGFTTFDLNVALQLPADRWFGSPTLRLDVSNITNKRFPLTNLPSWYGGTPRYTTLTLQSDF